MEDAMQAEEQPKLSRYFQAGSPLRCALQTCQKPVRGTCVHANDDRFYCCHGCAVEAASIDRTNIEDFKPRRK
jgi:hypothetical protein